MSSFSKPGMHKSEPGKSLFWSSLAAQHAQISARGGPAWRRRHMPPRRSTHKFLHEVAWLGGGGICRRGAARTNFCTRWPGLAAAAYAAAAQHAQISARGGPAWRRRHMPPRRSTHKFLHEVAWLGGGGICRRGAARTNFCTRWPGLAAAAYAAAAQHAQISARGGLAWRRRHMPPRRSTHKFLHEVARLGGGGICRRGAARTNFCTRWPGLAAAAYAAAAQHAQISARGGLACRGAECLNFSTR